MAEQRTLGTSRVLPFSPARIFNAISAPELLAQWWGPEGFSNRFSVFEFVPSGRWRFTMQGPDGTEYDNDSYFVDIVPEQKVVIRHDCQPYFTLTISLTAQAGATLLNWQQVFDDAATANAVREIAGPGNEQNLDRLTRVLAALASTASHD